MPSMIFLDPTMRQAPAHENKFDEQLVLQKARKDVNGLVQKCKESLTHPYQPNTIISLVSIPNGQFIDETVQAYRKVAWEKNRELRHEGADIHLDVRESNGNFYFVAGLYGKPEAEAQLKGSFVLDLASMKEADYLNIVSGMDIDDKAHFVAVVKDAYFLAGKGQLDLGHVVVRRTEEGYQLEQEKHVQQEAKVALSKEHYQEILDEVLEKSEIGNENFMTGRFDRKKFLDATVREIRNRGMPVEKAKKIALLHNSAA